MTIQRDLMGEIHISIPDNKVLENAANRLLAMYQENPNLFDGFSKGEIDRKIFAEILWQDGLQLLIPTDKKGEYVKTMLAAPEGEVVTRAFRWLVQNDHIRLSAKVIKSAEQMRARIAQSMK